MTFCNLNGQLTATEKAAIPIGDRGFRYGDGVFETIAVQEGVPCHFEFHMARLAGGLKALRIKFDPNPLEAQCRELLKANQMADGLLRIQITRGSGSRGYLPTASQALYIIETMPAPEAHKEAVSLYLSSYRKISSAALPVEYKLCQGMNSTLARLEASEHGCFDGLQLNDKNHVCETSSGNIFWLKDGTLYTPALACGVLKGSTREAVMRFSPYPVKEVSEGLDALLKAEAAIITNVAWTVLPVKELHGHNAVWESLGLAQQLTQLLIKDRANYSVQHRSDWA